MKIKTSELTDSALDYAAAVAEGHEITYDGIAYVIYLDGAPHWIGTKWKNCATYSPSTKGGDCMRIIKRERIAICPDSNYELRGGRWSAVDWGGNIVEFGPTPELAATRCYVASKLGDEVDVPEELL